MTTLAEPAVTPSEQPSLPPGWMRTTLGNVVTAVAKRVEPDQAAEAVYVGLEHISKGTGQLLFTGLGSEVTSTKTAFEPGDVLYGKLRPYLSKVALASMSGICSTDILALRPMVGMVPEFLKYRLLSRDFVMFASSNVSGVQHPRVDARTVASFPLSLPPLAEQQRIVTKIEELFSKLDAGVAELKRTQALLKRYRQSVLHSAVTGELSREWREQNPATETGAELLVSILQERQIQGGQKGKYKEPQKPKGDNLPDLPVGWVWTSIDQLSHLITSGSRGWADFYASKGATFIRAQDIKTDALDLKNVAHVDLSSVTEGLRTRVRQNDLLITITGANVTKTARVNIPLEEAYVSQHVALVRLACPQDSPYVYLCVITPTQGRGQLEKYAYGLGKPGLNLDNIREVVIALPPRAEQAYIVSEVERRLSLLDNMELTVAAELKRAESTRQSILHRAFTGELVPQDPNDEPASVLLERIQTEKLKAGAKAIRDGAGKRGHPRKAPTQPTLLEEQ